MIEIKFVSHFSKLLSRKYTNIIFHIIDKMKLLTFPKSSLNWSYYLDVYSWSTISFRSASSRTICTSCHWRSSNLRSLPLDISDSPAPRLICTYKTTKLWWDGNKPNSNFFCIFRIDGILILNIYSFQWKIKCFCVQ